MAKDEILQARNDLIQQTMEKIRNFREFHNFTTHVDVEFKHLGLQYKSETREFLETPNWHDHSKINEYLREIAFLYAAIIDKVGLAIK